EDSNDPILNLCNNLIQNIYNTAEFKERLIITDAVVESINDHFAHISQYNRIKDFIIFFGEVIYYFEYLAKMDYILLMNRKFNKAVGDNGFDEGNKYQFTMKGLEMCKFAELFFKIEEFSSSFQKFYQDCHDSLGNE
ncbi:2097_t:CDS:2, partial [Scutellospora calospora]